MPVAVVLTLTPRTASRLLAHCLMIKAKWKQRWWRQQRLHQQLLSSERFLPIKKRLLWKPDLLFLTYSNPSLTNSDYNWMNFVSRDNFLNHFYNHFFWHQLAFPYREQILSLSECFPVIISVLIICKAVWWTLVVDVKMEIFIWCVQFIIWTYIIKFLSKITVPSYYLSFGYISRSEINGSYTSPIFNLLRSPHTVFRNDHTNLHSHQTVCKGSLSSSPLPTLVFSCFLGNR